MLYCLWTALSRPCMFCFFSFHTQKCFWSFIIYIHIRLFTFNSVLQTYTPNLSCYGIYITFFVFKISFMLLRSCPDCVSIFYSREKDWGWQKSRHYPLQKSYSVISYIIVFIPSLIFRLVLNINSVKNNNSIVSQIPSFAIPPSAGHCEHVKQVSCVWMSWWVCLCTFNGAESIFQGFCICSCHTHCGWLASN